MTGWTASMSLVTDCVPETPSSLSVTFDVASSSSSGSDAESVMSIVCEPGVELWLSTSTSPTPSRSSNCFCRSAEIDSAETPDFELTI